MGGVFLFVCLFFLNYLFIYFWLCWVFVSVWGLSPVAASGGHSSSRCAGLSLSRPLVLRNTGSRRTGSVAVAHGRSCSAACGILPDQGSNPCSLHWQADSQPDRKSTRLNSSHITISYAVFCLKKKNKLKKTNKQTKKHHPQKNILLLFFKGRALLHES